MGFGVIYIYYSNRLSMVINLQGLGKYECKLTGHRKNLQANIGQMYELTRTDGREMY